LVTYFLATAGHKIHLVGKEVAVDFASEITVENTQEALIEAYENTLTLLQSTIDNLIQTLVQSKEQLQEAALNFDSAESFDRTKSAAGLAVEKTVEVVDDVGVFSAIDAVVHSVAKLPQTLNKVLSKENVDEMEEEAIVEEIIKEEEEKARSVKIVLDEKDEEFAALEEELSSAAEKIELAAEKALKEAEEAVEKAAEEIADFFEEEKTK